MSELIMDKMKKVMPGDVIQCSTAYDTEMLFRYLNLLGYHFKDGREPSEKDAYEYWNEYIKYCSICENNICNFRFYPFKEKEKFELIHKKLVEFADLCDNSEYWGIHVFDQKKFFPKRSFYLYLPYIYDDKPEEAMQYMQRVLKKYHLFLPKKCSAVIESYRVNNRQKEKSNRIREIKRRIFK